MKIEISKKLSSDNFLLIKVEFLTTAFISANFKKEHQNYLITASGLIKKRLVFLLISPQI